MKYRIMLQGMFTGLSVDSMHIAKRRLASIARQFKREGIRVRFDKSRTHLIVSNQVYMIERE